MDTQGHILFAHKFDGKGGGTSLAGDGIAKEVKDNALAWVHLDGDRPETHTWLEKEIAYLDPFIVQALLADETRPRMTQIKVTTAQRYYLTEIMDDRYGESSAVIVSQLPVSEYLAVNRRQRCCQRNP